jgi:hypothetical protein
VEKHQNTFTCPPLLHARQLEPWSAVAGARHHRAPPLPSQPSSMPQCPCPSPCSIAHAITFASSSSTLCVSRLDRNPPEQFGHGSPSLAPSLTTTAGPPRAALGWAKQLHRRVRVPLGFLVPRPPPALLPLVWTRPLPPLSVVGSLVIVAGSPRVIVEHAKVMSRCALTQGYCAAPPLPPVSRQRATAGISSTSPALPTGGRRERPSPPSLCLSV